MKKKKEKKTRNLTRAIPISIMLDTEYYVYSYPWIDLILNRSSLVRWFDLCELCVVENFCKTHYFRVIFLTKIYCSKVQQSLSDSAAGIFY